jgi:hypothetical protein
MLARKESHVGNMFETQFTYSWDNTSFMMYFGDIGHALYPTQQHQVEAMKGPKPWTDVWWFHLFVCLALGDDLNSQRLEEANSQPLLYCWAVPPAWLVALFFHMLWATGAWAAQVE